MSQMTKNITRLSLSKHFYSRKVCLYVLFFSKFSFSYAFQIICIKLTCWTKCFANGNHNIRFSVIVVTKNTPTKTSWKRLAIWLRTKRQKRPKADIQKQEIEDRQAIPWKKKNIKCCYTFISSSAFDPWWRQICYYIHDLFSYFYPVKWFEEFNHYLFVFLQ